MHKILNFSFCCVFLEYLHLKMNAMTSWDRAKSIRAGFKPLEALAFDLLEWQPFHVVRYGTPKYSKRYLGPPYYLSISHLCWAPLKKQ